MDMSVEDIGECESKFCEDPDVTLDLVSYRVDDDCFVGIIIGEDLCVCPSLLIEELAEDYVRVHSV